MIISPSIETVAFLTVLLILMHFKFKFKCALRKSMDIFMESGTRRRQLKDGFGVFFSVKSCDCGGHSWTLFCHKRS